MSVTGIRLFSKSLYERKDAFNASDSLACTITRWSPDCHRHAAQTREEPKLEPIARRSA
ncbi:hypothetical protein XAP6164_3050023 [Xanthomonas phaseoli pv. phaseoli]|nr:hypothetical protein XAP6164_3050023 [Xanthomonas phaseoli pv. phaseoli]